MVRHPKSKAKTEDAIVTVKFNDAIPVDLECPLIGNFKVMQEPGRNFYNAMLNQTNIASNNNKYYILQVIVFNLFYASSGFIFLIEIQSKNMNAVF